MTPRPVSAKVKSSRHAQSKLSYMTQYERWLNGRRTTRPSPPPSLRPETAARAREEAELNIYAARSHPNPFIHKFLRGLFK